MQPENGKQISKVDTQRVKLDKNENKQALTSSSITTSQSDTLALLKNKISDINSGIAKKPKRIIYQLDCENQKILQKTIENDVVISKLYSDENLANKRQRQKIERFKIINEKSEIKNNSKINVERIKIEEKDTKIDKNYSEIVEIPIENEQIIDETKEKSLIQENQKQSLELNNNQDKKAADQLQSSNQSTNEQQNVNLDNSINQAQTQQLEEDYNNIVMQPVTIQNINPDEIINTVQRIPQNTVINMSGQLKSPITAGYQLFSRLKKTNDAVVKSEASPMIQSPPINSAVQSPQIIFAQMITKHNEQIKTNDKNSKNRNNNVQITENKKYEQFTKNITNNTNIISNTESKINASDIRQQTELISVQQAVPETQSQSKSIQVLQIVQNPVPFIPVFEQYTNVAQQQYTLKIVFYFEIQPKFYIFNLLKNEDFVLSETLISVAQNKNEYTLQFKFENSDVGTYPHLLIYSPQNIFQVVLTYSPVQPTAKFQKDYESLLQFKINTDVYLINPFSGQYDYSTINFDDYQNIEITNCQIQFKKEETKLIPYFTICEQLPQCAITAHSLQKQFFLQFLKNSISCDPEQLSYFTEQFQKRLEQQDNQQNIVYDRSDNLTIIQNLQPYILNFQKPEQATLTYLAFLFSKNALFNRFEENNFFKQFIQQKRSCVEYNNQSLWSKPQIKTQNEIQCIPMIHNDLQISIAPNSYAVIVGTKDNQIIDYIELHQTKQLGLSFFDADLELWVMGMSCNCNSKLERMQIPNITDIQKKVEKQKSKKKTFKVDYIDPMNNLIPVEIIINGTEINIKKLKETIQLKDLKYIVGKQNSVLFIGKNSFQFQVSEVDILEIVLTIKQAQQKVK